MNELIVKLRLSLTFSFGNYMEILSDLRRFNYGTNQTIKQVEDQVFLIILILLVVLLLFMRSWVIQYIL